MSRERKITLYDLLNPCNSLSVCGGVDLRQRFNICLSALTSILVCREFAINTHKSPGLLLQPEHINIVFGGKGRENVCGYIMFNSDNR